MSGPLGTAGVAENCISGHLSCGPHIPGVSCQSWVVLTQPGPPCWDRLSWDPSFLLPHPHSVDRGPGCRRQGSGRPRASLSRASLPRPPPWTMGSPQVPHLMVCWRSRWGPAERWASVPPSQAGRAPSGPQFPCAEDGSCSPPRLGVWPGWSRPLFSSEGCAVSAGRRYPGSVCWGHVLRAFWNWVAPGHCQFPGSLWTPIATWWGAVRRPRGLVFSSAYASGKRK